MKKIKAVVKIIFGTIMSLYCVYAVVMMNLGKVSPPNFQGICILLAICAAAANAIVGGIKDWMSER